MNLDRRLENAYFSSDIEVTESSLVIPFDYTWISNFSINKKIGIRRIAAEIDSRWIIHLIFKYTIPLSR
jgi:hypothetical protein